MRVVEPGDDCPPVRVDGYSICTAQRERFPLEPTTTNLPFLTAKLVATGRRSSTVTTFALVTIRSAGTGCPLLCRVPEYWRLCVRRYVPSGVSLNTRVRPQLVSDQTMLSLDDIGHVTRFERPSGHQSMAEMPQLDGA